MVINVVPIFNTNNFYCYHGNYPKNSQYYQIIYSKQLLTLPMKLSQLGHNLGLSELKITIKVSDTFPFYLCLIDNNNENKNIE